MGGTEQSSKEAAGLDGKSNQMTTKEDFFTEQTEDKKVTMVEKCLNRAFPDKK